MTESAPEIGDRVSWDGDLGTVTRVKKNGNLVVKMDDGLIEDEHMSMFTKLAGENNEPE